MTSQRGESAVAATGGRRGLDKSHYLYIAVILAVVLGAVVGLLFPEVGKSLKPLGDGFIKLIKMMIAPVIFCTIVLGIGSIAKAATVGKVGGLALGYFVAMSTFALAIGLVVGNLIHPGEGPEADSVRSQQEGGHGQHGGLPAGHHPRRHSRPAHPSCSHPGGLRTPEDG
ncbi:hypothetical protein StoSoilB13_00400 [Arthrobacter sp. StoSoilB13]|nr:hypothetical protein StoSoilB13_00400 [Arthrobacter sp. StoSoilB13]